MHPTNRALTFLAPPPSLPVPGIHLSTLPHSTNTPPNPFNTTSAPPNGLMLHLRYASLDPYVRLMMIAPETKHYRKAFDVGRPMRSICVAEVVASDRQDRGVEVGDMVRVGCEIAEWVRLTGDEVDGLKSSGRLKVIRRKRESGDEDESEGGGERNLKDVYWLGALGMPGLTAYAGLYEIGKPKKGETVFVSAAAGAVGQVVGQLARLEGCRVIGSVGDERKLALIKGEWKFDEGFVYKKERTRDALRRLVPEGVDVYFDNVGGETLEDAIGGMKKGGRIVCCGMVSQYNVNMEGKGDTAEDGYGVRNLFQFVSKGLTMRGFQVGDEDFGPKYEREFEERMRGLIEEGKLKVVMSEMGDIGRGAEAFVGMLKGEAEGKAVLNVQDVVESGGWRRV